MRAAEPVLTGTKLSPMGFTNFLLDEKQWIFNNDHRVVYQDMTQPLSHYYIATSHNTYVTRDLSCLQALVTEHYKQR